MTASGTCSTSTIPFGDTWGHMSWGHAVSRDLVRWEHLPLALAEENGRDDFFRQRGGGLKEHERLRQGRQAAARRNLHGASPTDDPDPAHRLQQRSRADVDEVRRATRCLILVPRIFAIRKFCGTKPTARWIMSVALVDGTQDQFLRLAGSQGVDALERFRSGGLDERAFGSAPTFFRCRVEDGGEKWVLIVNVGSGGPARSPTRQPVGGFRGRGLVNSYENSNVEPGDAHFAHFEIAAGHISFLIGGGSHAETRVDLHVDGKIVRTAKGRERERLAWKAWDVRDLRGAEHADIQVVDRHSGGWGHINLDHVILADEPARPGGQWAQWADYGADFYAGVSWSDVPASDGRHVWLGWMSNWEYANEVPRRRGTVPCRFLGNCGSSNQAKDSACGRFRLQS